MHITLTGNLGSGKSTICKILEDKYGFEIYSTGKVQRTIAEELGISVLEMNQLMCTDHKYDKMIDDTTARISRENKDKNIIFDSRLAWYFVESSFKIFLSVSLDVAAMRVYNDNRGAVERYSSISDAKEQLRLRAETENIRYKDIYDIEYFNFNNYNLILDSTFCTPELLAEVIFSEAGKGSENQKGTKILMSPKRLGTVQDFANVRSGKYYPDNIVIIKKTEQDFAVADGMESVLEAAAVDCFPFVQAELLV